jgi:hypothetical protein
MMIVEFECYWQRKEYEMMGRAFITQRYVCFESTLFGFPSRVCFAYQHNNALHTQTD